jgi:ribonuclease J
VTETVTPRNGDMVRLAPGLAEIIDEVPSGRLYVDGGMLTTEDGEALRERRHMSHSGVLTVSVVLDGRGRIASGPQVRGVGLPSDMEYPLGEMLDDLARIAGETVQRLGDRDDDEQVEQALMRSIKKASQRIWGRRPIVEATVLRV